MTVIQQALQVMDQAKREIFDLRAQNADLLDALKLARNYVTALHVNIAGAMGHENTCVRPDLEKIDAAINRADRSEVKEVA